MLARVRGLSGWPRIIARNRWFQRKVVNALTSLAAGASRVNLLTSDLPGTLLTASRSPFSELQLHRP